MAGEVVPELHAHADVQVEFGGQDRLWLSCRVR
jgi:hypothetical protein